MKKLLLMGMFLVLLFQGCVTDRAYNAAKGVYKGTKIVVKAGKNHIGKDRLEKLKKIDRYATTYDAARSAAREGFDVNSTK